MLKLRFKYVRTYVRHLIWPFLFDWQKNILPVRSVVVHIEFAEVQNNEGNRSQQFFIKKKMLCVRGTSVQLR